VLIVGGVGGGATGGGEAGGSAAGGSAAGGSAAGGSAAGGSAAGGSAAGGSAAGGSAAGGSAAGGSAGGGSAGGSAAGGSAAGGSAGGSADAGTSDFCAELAQRECDYYVRCAATGNIVGGVVTTRLNNVVPPSQRTLCEATRRLECREEQAGIERARRAINVSALRTCLDAAFPSTSCQRDRNLAIGACALTAFTTPLAAPGAICTADVECASGWCSNIGASGCGACQPFANVDGGTGICTRDEECAPGSYCRVSAGPDTCAPQGGADAGCTSTSQCQPGFVCPNTGASVRACTAGKPEGALCVKGRAECLRTTPTSFELLCATQPGVMDGGADRCVKRFNTAPGGFCNTAETATGIPSGPVCLDSEFCNNGLCEPRRPPGQPCATAEACQWGSRCSGGACTAYGDVGALCTASDQCRALLYCTGGMGTCQPAYATAGQMCSTTTFPQCVNQTYCPGTGMQSCVAQKPNGQSCMNDNECLNGDCNGACTNACWR
jgi:hypothetical protein